MNGRLKIILWILPISGIVLGYAYAFLLFHGLLATWHFIGKPDENITRIIGIRGGSKVLVSTETGKTYSFKFDYGEKVVIPSQLSWEKEQLDTVDKVSPLQYGGADFFTLPPPFQVKQLFTMEYIYEVEGKGEVKFALAPDGNLWMWHHEIAGLTGLVFMFYPPIGCLIGVAIILFVKAVYWLKNQNFDNHVMVSN